VQSLTRADIERWQADVAAGREVGPRAVAHIEGGKGAAARALANLRAMLSWAVEREIIAENPAKGVRPFHGRKCERFLSSEELARLGEALTALQVEGELNAHAFAVIRLLILTGCRKSEILTLQWPFVNFDRRCLELPNSKIGAKMVPLAASAWRFWPACRGTSRGRRARTGCSRRRAAAAIHCPTRTGKGWRRGRGLPGVRVHDLRHSYASVAVSDGVSLYVTAKLLGHKQSRTTERYPHLGDDPVRAAAERTAKRIADAMRGVADGGEVVKLERGKG
jgi:integrase